LWCTVKALMTGPRTEGRGRGRILACGRACVARVPAGSQASHHALHRPHGHRPRGPRSCKLGTRVLRPAAGPRGLRRRHHPHSVHAATMDSTRPQCTRLAGRELHTGKSPDKFALCSPRTGHPGRPVPAKPERKKNGRPFVRWPEFRPDKSGPAQAGPALPARSPTEAQWPKRPQRSTLQSVVVASSSPKPSPAARQNRRRPRAKRDAARQLATQKAYGQTGPNRAGQRSRAV
jgi:hypothetical protein